MRHKRLDSIDTWLSDGILVSWKDVPETLRYHGLATKNYNMKCLLMDVWYLKRSYCSPTVKSSDDMDTDHAKLGFQIILRSLLDLQTGRPCDLGLWKRDMPSDLQICSVDAHICYEDSEAYLLQVDSEMEANCGMPPGKVRDLVNRMKKDPIFMIGSVLSQEAPTSFVSLAISNLSSELRIEL